MRVVDFHVHPIPKIISEKELLREVEHASVDLAVLLALDVDSHHLEDKHTLTNFLEECINYSNWNCLGCLETIKNILQTCFTSNEYIAKLVKNNPKKFIGVGSINPSKKMSYVKEKLREIDKLSMAGVKLIPTLQFFNPLKEKSKLERIFEFCEDKQKIIIFHTGCDPAIWEEPSFSQNANPAMLKYYASKFKKVPIILAHMGSYSRRYPGIWFDEAVELGKKYSNVWFDISAVPYLLTEKKYVDKISRELGWDRVLFGSDYPVVGSSSIVSMLNIIRDSSLLSENNLEKVLYQNALKVLGL